ncbi:uncharacterized protein J3R85_015232 [Psidium guajava]|nr:uncharacterized protein J3R85_015232 [Psidium guajava]
MRTTFQLLPQHLLLTDIIEFINFDEHLATHTNLDILWFLVEM